MRQTFQSDETRQTIGAALLSAAGSLPLHLAPLLIATLLASRSISNAEAASLVSYIMAGEIVAALLSTKFRIEDIGRPLMTGLFLIYAASILSSIWAVNPFLFGAAWFATGLVSGLLMQFGIVAAARSPTKLNAFAYRLSFALFFSGTVSIFLLTFGENPSYRQLIGIYGAVLLSIFLAGILLWRGKVPSRQQSLSSASDSFTMVDAIGLSLLMLFFAGQIGFLSNSAHFTVANDLSLGATSVAIGLSKLLISFVIFWVALRGNTPSPRQQLFYSGALAVSATFVFTQNVWIFVAVAFIGFELFLNLMSAAFMASLSERFSSRAKTLLFPATVIGVLVGPPLAGYFIDTGLTVLVLALATLSAFVPLAWPTFAQKRKKTANHLTP